MLEISAPQLKEIYNNLNCTFDTFNGEFGSLEYLDELNKIVSPYLIESDGAQVIDVNTLPAIEITTNEAIKSKMPKIICQTIIYITSVKFSFNVTNEIITQKAE